MSDDTPLDELINQATAAAKSKRFDEAAALLESILERDPDNLRALDLFGFVRFFQRRYEDAEAFCRRALAIDANRAYPNKGLGLCLAKQGELEAGVEALERAIALNPEWPDPYWDMAVVLVEHQRYDDALKILARGQVNAPTRRSDFLRLTRQIKQRRTEE